MLDQREYFGNFWIPSNDSTQTPQKMRGRLKVVEGESVLLELSEVVGLKFLMKQNTINVLWGDIFGDISITLFCISFHQLAGKGIVSLSVKYALYGCHVFSLDTPAFNECEVKYPYLHHWASTKRLLFQQENDSNHIFIDNTNILSPLVKTELENGLQAMICENILTRISSYKIAVEQSSFLKFETNQNVSFKCFHELIIEFTQFIAIAQYFQQYPTEIYLNANGEKVQVLFSVEHSDQPHPHSLIQFSELKNKIPEMMRRWHSNYTQVSPICRYLIQTIHYNTFDFPDFLIVAHALEGYHKRFLNKKNGGKDKQKYKEQVDILLDKFKDVEVIKKSNIDTEVLTQSRDKYSHLIPDEEKPLAVTGQELYDLTIKCKVLLTCCILDLLGLNIEEINMCWQKFIKLFDF